MATVPSVVAGQELATLHSMLRAMFPHERFPDGPYERCAQSIAEAASHDHRSSVQLHQGLAELEAAGFGDMDADAQLAYLESISTTPFFAIVRADAVVKLYDDREVWELLGYRTDSFSEGGWIDRGFDDLDWLPAARIEEAS